MFIGRKEELVQLQQVTKKDKAALVIVYGRRRTGKTTLIEHAYKNRNLLKIEGVEGQSQNYQIENFLDTLNNKFNDPILKTAKPKNWKQAFEILGHLVSKGEWTVYLEELQWMAEYAPDLISELKPVWDNILSKNPKLILVLCGSSPSYFITHVIRSKALHNRSAVEIHLEEFPLKEAKLFLKNLTLRSTFDTYLSVGGIPIYLEKINDHSSPYLGLIENCAKKNSFFVEEFEKIFVSSFGKNTIYREIVELIARKRRITRSELLKTLKLESGGSTSRFLVDLEECGFIKKITPLDKTTQNAFGYYQIQDPYLDFYFKFIKPNIHAIRNGDYKDSPQRLIDIRTYSQWLGFCFERFCRKNTGILAKILGFSAVKFKAGTLFKRKNINDFGFQVDLLFDRADRVRTICEIKYQEAPVGLDVIEQVEKKILALDSKRNINIDRVLITASGITKELKERHYFDRVLGLEDLIG